MTELVAAIGTLLAGVGSLAAWKHSKEAKTIVKGNGHGDVARMQERTLDELQSIRQLLVDHITDPYRHN